MLYKWFLKSIGIFLLMLILLDFIMLINIRNKKSTLHTMKHTFQWKHKRVIIEGQVYRTINQSTTEGQVSKTTEKATINDHIMTQDQVCVHPVLEPFGSHVMPFIHKEKPVTCPDDLDWVIIKDTMIILKIPKSEIDKHGKITCSVSFIERDGDKTVKFKSPIYFENSLSINLSDDFFKLVCTKGNSEEIHVRFHAGIAPKSSALNRQFNPSPSGLGLNVFILGFDSISHMSFLRNLPKSHDYFTKTMGGIVLNGYNIVGDATFKALCPILTGKTDLELPPTMKLDRNPQPTDVYPLIWKNYSQEGYVTAYAEDEPAIGLFQFRRSGFKQQPTDHYMRPYYLAELVTPHVPKDERFCRGSKHRVHVFLDWIKDFFSTYPTKSKFTFAFHSQQSHTDNINLVSTVDEDLLIGLKSLVTGRFLDNTMFILMADHGNRFTGLRATLQGKQEERRPFMGIFLPQWFKAKYPKVIKNLQTNVNRLSTPFDIHETLTEILHYTGDGMGNTSQRGISLFKEIPKSRSCHQADIQTHWCACLKWEPLALSDAIAINAAQHLVNHINYITLPFRHKCHELKLHNMTRALKLMPTSGILRFKGAFDIDKLNEDFTDHMSPDIIQIQVTIATKPSNALYEATLIYQKSLNKYKTNTEVMSRLDKYGKTSACILEEKGDLRPFCFCK